MVNHYLTLLPNRVCVYTQKFWNSLWYFRRKLILKHIDVHRNYIRLSFQVDDVYIISFFPPEMFDMLQKLD